ncbi:hypothetical protein P12x_005580 [Tundrisphaera lichenicola]|uniref:hypothetical protein n=1 Tax=Tundrisphaera lichenicola TaxID=2029860 RepID=UPI003EC070A9
MSNATEVRHDPTGDVPKDVATVEKAVAKAEAKVDRVVDASLKKIKRVYVAVHGIGDQSQFETIQHVASQLGLCSGSPTSIPLGSFHSERTERSGFLFVESPPYPARFKDVGFAEIYWADIPREVQKEGHSLEEAKKWAATLVARIRMRDRVEKSTSDERQKAAKARDYQMLEQVIGEIIEGVAVLDRVLSLAGKVSSFKFQLKDLLDSFLGDVQVVTDFEVQRVKLLAQFHAIMDKIRQANGDADIYVVAHSEGTVVSFLALLQAFREYQPAAEGHEEQFGWIKQVKGLMTIGSPIEEHMILWPELFNRQYQATQDPATGEAKPLYRWKPERPEDRIKWRNYLDFGDPIAYRLKSTGEWIRKNRWGDVLEFEKFDAHDPGRHEIIFSRYLFPGKAHGDYWGDDEVFGHFIKTVVEETANSPSSEPGLDERYRKPPESRWGVGFFTRVVPYLIPLLLLMAAVWFMTRGVHGFLYPEGWKHVAGQPDVEVGEMRHISRDVVGISLLLMGITVAARVPRLSRSWRAMITAYVIFLAGVAAYPLVATKDTREFLGSFTRMFAGAGPVAGQPTIADSREFAVAGSQDLAGWVQGLAGHYTSPVLGLMALAGILVLVAMVLSATRPGLGTRTLIVPGFLIILGLVIHGIAAPDRENPERGPVWQVLLSGLAFLYLWWLAVVFFDLIYVWHIYIRGSIWDSIRGVTMTDRLRDLCEDPTSPSSVPG